MDVWSKMGIIHSPVRHIGINRSLAAGLMLCTLSLAQATAQSLSASAQKAPSRPDIQQLLQNIAAFSADPCGAPVVENQTSAALERSIFWRASEIITDKLNSTNDVTPRERAAEALRTLERISAVSNASWPEDSRFHFEILDLPPALVLKMSLRTGESFFVFGVPETSGKKVRRWQYVDSDNELLEQQALYTRLELYPLRRGPSGHARFLAKFSLGGCAGSSAVAYDAREWYPERIAGLEQIIKQDGAFGLDEVAGFPRIGKLRTEGPIITLPYCWFSPIDTWDNPSLCAVDTYDLSGDTVRFRSRTYNRPDLVPIAKAIEYAEKREYRAVLGYCASSEVARALVRDLPPFIFAGELRVTRTGIGKERVEMGFETVYRFDVEKRNDDWQIIAFSAK